MKRRSFLALSTVASATLITGCFADAFDDKDIPKVKANAEKSLVIPPLIEGAKRGDAYHYDLKIHESKHWFFDNVLTDTYAVNGTYLAPTLKLINGQDVSINYTNNLSETTTMHGHGMHVPANMDGTAHQKIAPLATWSAMYRVNQKACTNWYHPHALDKTAEHVYQGLAGLIIIEDEESQKLDLPRAYGVDDIPLVLQDKFFDTNGQIYYNPTMHQTMMGYKGDTLMTNGVLNPYVDVEAKEIRLRLLNGSNSTVYELKLNDNRTFNQIAGDNSFLEKPVEMNTLGLSPGERAEIIIDFTASLGKTVHLEESRQGKTFLKFKVSKKAKETTKVPQELTTLLRYNPKDAVKTRHFTLSGRMGRVYINNKTMDMNRIDEVMRLNDIEIWEISNKKMMMMKMEHNFHIHGTHFMVLERNGSVNNVLENEKGYKDTVYLAPGDRVKLIVKMTDYVDKKVPYMYHCHFLEHEDAGMMGQFLVV
ncbi:MAG: Multicopper oxidase [uncultured Sulfurovum sp.]|uniref:Multicopper oxidase n=1 Tax=uncultured Sulfurovum sp. TaxID=269237 RepID=A0A6S6SLQ6_9BACT|nr:MAG: Multicopper oxidase [uncultured Sulfurovum sp.]